MVFVDGSANNESSVGIVLISNKGEEIKLVIWLKFRSSNNDTEYKDLLIGLRTAQNVGIAWVLVHLDFSTSSLTSGRHFDIKGKKLRKYREAMEHSKEHFVEMWLKQVPWVENHWADELAWLTSSLGEWTTWKIMAQVELFPRSTRLDVGVLSLLLGRSIARWPCADEATSTLRRSIHTYW